MTVIIICRELRDTIGEMPTHRGDRCMVSYASGLHQGQNNNNNNDGSCVCFRDAIHLHMTPYRDHHDAFRCTLLKPPITSY